MSFFFSPLPLVPWKFNKRKTQFKLLGCFNSLSFSTISQASKNKGRCLPIIPTEKSSLRPYCKLQGFIKEKSTWSVLLPRSRSHPVLRSSAAVVFLGPGLSGPRAKGWEGRSYLVGAPSPWWEPVAMVKERRASSIKTDLYEYCWYHKYVCRSSQDACWEGGRSGPCACIQETPGGMRAEANVNTTLLNV